MVYAAQAASADISGGPSVPADIARPFVGSFSRLAHVKAGHVELSKSVRQLVIDEADLVFSYGYQDDLVALLAKLPKVVSEAPPSRIIAFCYLTHFFNFMSQFCTQRKSFAAPVFS